MKTKLILIAMAALSTGAFAQFDFGGGSSAPSKPAWESFKLPAKTMKLDFRNANVDMVLSLFTKTSGITIVKDPGLNTPISLTSAKAVPLNQAFEILNAALSVRNYELKKEGNLLVIRAKPQQGRGPTQGSTSMSSDAMRTMMESFSGSQTKLKVYPIQFANASQVARVINEVFAQQQNPLSNLAMMFGGMQQQGGRGGRGGGRFGGGSPFGSFGSSQSSVRASSDDFSNSVIVNAPDSSLKQVEELIKQIDKQTEEPQKAKVYKLEYAASTDLQPVVQGVLTANLPRGRGGVNASNNGQGGGGGGGGAFFGFLGGGNQQRNQLLQGAVVSDARTNSLIVTTTEDNQKLVEQVIKELDTEIKMESTTFVFPLENARADQIATLMQQAFGTRSGGGNRNAGGTRTTGTNRTNTNNNNNRRTNGGGGTGGFGGGQLNNDLQIDLEDPTLDAGELQTNVAVQGGIFGQFFGGQRQGGQNSQQNTVPTGRDSQGRLVPVQDLTNQITVIPDQNTNSIIVVGTPESADIIRQILAQLDKIPEQVMIETMIVEASLDANSKMGVEWQLVTDRAFGDKGVTGTGAQGFGANRATAEGFKYTLAGGSLTAFINALKTDTKFNVLSTPKIFTSNNVQAEINISQRVPFVVSQRTDANGNITYNYDFEDVGIVLTVTPRITSGGYVTMEVSQTANDLQGFTSFNAPIVNQRQADTTVAVKDGETVILGGIMRSTVSSTVKKVPLLGDIPLLGNLFKSTDRTNSKTELMVFLTPRVVRNPEEASKLTDEQKKKLSQPTRDQLNKATGGGGKADNSQKKQDGG